ncbi:MAG TPA: hypothetical protein VMT55_04865, partial [Candidatus Sulfotelmatobacter sp.]|nr:hypothetical protein [Candidatus Sulfotelmatobacter sp.]
RELKLVNRSLYKTFARVFPFVTVVPGNYNYYFGSDSRIELNARRWRARRITTKYFRYDTLNYILWPDKLAYVGKAVSFEASTPVNRRLAPITYYLGLLLWASYFSDGLKEFFYAAAARSAADILFALICIAVFLKSLSWRRPKLKLPLAVMLLGFCGMCGQLVVIYAFQALYGYVYQTIGLLTALFMAGLSAGSYLMVRRAPRDPERTIKLFIWSLMFFLPVLFFCLEIFPLPLASFLIALPIGAIFPLAVKLRGTKGSVLYGADLAGGALGAIVTTVFLLPLFGVPGVFAAGWLMAAAALLIAYS